MTFFVPLLTVALLVFCLAACVAGCIRRTEPFAAPLLVGACLLAVALLAANAVMAEGVPFGNMRHVLSFFPLVMAPCAFFLKRRGHDLLPYFAGAAAVAVVGALCMPMQAEWRQMPALQSPWFVPHVTSYVVAYGMLAVSAVLAAAAWGQGASKRLESADAVLRLSFPFLTFGLLSGAIWADAAWGRYWAWDIKEAWSLLTWCLYLVYFHVQRHAAFTSWRRPLLLLGFVAVLITFFVVNLLPHIVSVHSYAK